MIEVGASEFPQKSLMIIAFPKKTSIYNYMDTSKIILKTRVVEPCSLASNSTGGSAAVRKILRPAMPATMKNAAWMFGEGGPT